MLAVEEESAPVSERYAAPAEMVAPAPEGDTFLAAEEDPTPPPAPEGGEVLAVDNESAPASEGDVAPTEKVDTEPVVREEPAAEEPAPSPEGGQGAGGG